MTAAEKITRDIAQQLFDQSISETQSSIIIDGETFEWWTDGRSAIWFYEAGKDGEDTLKRFELETQLYEVTS